MVMQRESAPEPVAVVAGARTPLTKAGTALRDVDVTELAKVTMQETLCRAEWPAECASTR